MDEVHFHEEKNRLCDRILVFMTEPHIYGMNFVIMNKLRFNE
jgi:hypothetical protein